MNVSVVVKLASNLFARGPFVDRQTNAELICHFTFWYVILQAPGIGMEKWSIQLMHLLNALFKGIVYPKI